MTANLDLWNWMAASVQPGRNSKAQGQITMWDQDGTPLLTFVLTDILPVRIGGPSLNAQTGQVALEELQLVCANLSVRPAGQAGIGLSVGVSASADFSAGASFSASAGLSVSGGPGLSGSASAGFSIG